MNGEQLYASFLLDRESMLEIAMPADKVVEAISVPEDIKPMPSGNDYLEGIMQLRDNAIPVVNLKKRFKIPAAEYSKDAKVAVVQLNAKLYGLLFDDIRDVLWVPREYVEQLDPALFTKDSIVTDLIKLDSGKRTVQLLDLQRLFPPSSSSSTRRQKNSTDNKQDEKLEYRRYVAFICADQEYGVPVEDSREICFLSEIDETFRHGAVQGALQLRGHTIPVLNGRHLLLDSDEPVSDSEMSRVLVLEKSDISFGIIVDEIREIIETDKKSILPIPGGSNGPIQGICQYSQQRNILLLDPANLIDVHLDKIKTMGRFRPQKIDKTVGPKASHLITEHCYLIFSIGKNFAIELKDVQEIIETDELLALPDTSDVLHNIINLRGNIVPVLDLRTFYRQTKETEREERAKLLITQYNGMKVGLIVDEIVTIYKQEEFYPTPALRPELQDRKDTLDRFIEYIKETGLKEHVLVVNIENIMKNHLHLFDETKNIETLQNASLTDEGPNAG